MSEPSTELKDAMGSTVSTDSPAPWTAEHIPLDIGRQIIIFDADHRQVVSLMLEDFQDGMFVNGPAIADRIIACVNFLKGMPLDVMVRRDPSRMTCTSNTKDGRICTIPLKTPEDETKLGDGAMPSERETTCPRS